MIIYNQIESKLNGLFNHCVIESLKSHSESDCLNKLRDIENDLNTSYGYRFDNYIMKYNQSLQEIIKKHNIIIKIINQT